MIVKKGCCNKPEQLTPVPHTSIPLECLERYVKDRIVEKKVCACPRCSMERLYLRGIQYVLNEYKDIKHS